MKRQFLPESAGKEAYERFLRICGYGVPNLERALHCAANSLTLICQMNFSLILFEMAGL